MRANHRRAIFRRQFRAFHRPHFAEAAEGGALALVEEGDRIELDIPTRSIRLAIANEELLRRREVMEAQGLGAWKPVDRDRGISGALQAYSALATSASRGAVRDVSGLRR